ncbi:MAG TPA: deoxynucleoside kinase [Ignavibacteria bacterium]
MRKHFITISGNIGAGKSSLTKMLSEKLGWIPFYESVEDNPYLEDFYNDMKKWSFHLQIYFLSKRFNDSHSILKFNESVILDRTLYEDGEIFARNLYELGNMSERDYKNYKQLYNILINYLPKPDLMIYLRSDVDFLLQRIKKRSRDFEASIPKEYLLRLNNYYEEWISKYKISDLLIIDVKKYDYVNNSDDLNFVVNQIMERIKK